MSWVWTSTTVALEAESGLVLGSAKISFVLGSLVKLDARVISFPFVECVFQTQDQRHMSTSSFYTL